MRAIHHRLVDGTKVGILGAGSRRLVALGDILRAKSDVRSERGGARKGGAAAECGEVLSPPISMCARSITTWFTKRPCATAVPEPDAWLPLVMSP